MFHDRQFECNGLHYNVCFVIVVVVDDDVSIKFTVITDPIVSTCAFHNTGTGVNRIGMPDDILQFELMYCKHFKCPRLPCHFKGQYSDINNTNSNKCISKMT